MWSVALSPVDLLLHGLMVLSSAMILPPPVQSTRLFREKLIYSPELTLIKPWWFNCSRIKDNLFLPLHNVIITSARKSLRSNIHQLWLFLPFHAACCRLVKSNVIPSFNKKWFPLVIIGYYFHYVRVSQREKSESTSVHSLQSIPYTTNTWS